MEHTGFQENMAAQRAVSAWLREERFPHAVLLEGGNAAVRLEAARFLAAALVCSGGQEASLFGSVEKPCDTCTDCVKAQVGNHPDIRVVAGGEAAKSFHTASVREIRADAYVLPNEAQRKVYILEHVQNMTPSAQNALLMVLEEPPGAVCFLLLCENSRQMLPTILSRVSVLDLGVSQPQVNEAAQQAADALAKALAGEKEFALLQASAVFAKDKSLFRAALPLLQAALRDALLLQSGIQPQNGQAQAPLLASVLSRGQALACAAQIQNLLEVLDQNENYTLLTARFCSLLWEEREKEAISWQK